MAAEKRVNYTAELTAKITQDYEDGKSVEDIAAEIGKSPRSVRSKLVREGVYQAPEKAPAKPKDEGPTKKELLRDLETLAPAGIPIDGFVNATKPAIAWLVDYLSDEHTDNSEDETDENQSEGETSQEVATEQVEAA